ncbi:sensor histidine kinase [Candidatus Palauibacter sp.]|uniref:sensor histidine kinase n=1 Tax=Candidatus Palauibacter sp. TaxID=3101350 RepID=UPI003B522AA8
MKQSDERLHRAFAWAVARLPGGLGARARQATGGRFGIGSQIVVGLGSVVLLTISAILLALLLMSIVERGQSEVTQEQIPSLLAGHRVTQHSEALLRASPQLLSATDPAVLQDVRAAVLLEQDSLQFWVGEVGGAAMDADVASLAEDLVANINEIYESVNNRMAYNAGLAEMAAVVGETGLRLQLVLEEAIDDQYFFIRTGLRQLTDVPAPGSQRQALEEIQQLDGLLNFKASQNQAITLIQQAFAETDAELLLANQERVETALRDVRATLPRIRPLLRETLADAVSVPSELYGGPAGIFQTRRRELDEIGRAEELIERNRQTTAELDLGVRTLMERVEDTAREAANRSAFLVRLGFWFLLAVILFTIGAARIAWKTFGRSLIVRLSSLFETTRRMSEGDLEVKVEVEGNDEVTDMAHALEVFRKHALEVQRLNLVEKLAQEVQSKNEALEQTLDDLQRTQQQVITQEKLASLGALTAGIAHEIRNPLNFVNNFAVLSKELVEELNEELKEVAEGTAELDQEFIAEVLGDLDMNVTKVREHGGRADRIVEGMLAHSRDDAGDAETIDVNMLLDEYAKLAYHGLRGNDSSFNVTIDRDFDEEAGEVTGIARDLSRVFLNIVTNACHATAARKEQDGADYSPTVALRTEGHEDHVIVSIRDNGTGIPDSIARKIFEPFFTTKSGTQGTGLGLSISRDIVVGHGGDVAVESEPGKFTEFRIKLLRKSNISEVAAAVT